MRRPRSLLPLAVALLFAAFLSPRATDFGQLLARLNIWHGEAIANMRVTFGADLTVAGPRIVVPVRDEAGPSGRPIELYPADMAVDVDQTTHSVRRSGFPIGWMLADIRIAARFTAPDLTGLLDPGERPDWGRALIRVPVAAPQSLADHPEITLAGAVRRMGRTLGPHDRLSLEFPLHGVPEGEVLITMLKTGIGPGIIIGNSAARTRIRLSSDQSLERFSGPRPDEQRRGLWQDVHIWATDAGADFAQARREGRPPATSRTGFLGIQLREPDESGAVMMVSRISRPAYSRIDDLVRFSPLALLAGLLAAWGLRAQGYRPYLGLYLVTVATALTTAFLAPRLGPGLAWAAGSATLLVCAAMMLWPLGARRAIVAAAVMATAWVAVWRLWQVPAHAEELQTAGLLALSALTTLYAGVRAVFRGRRGKAAPSAP